MKYIFLLLFTVSVLIATDHAAASQPLTQDAARPNIVLILVDDMGYSDLGCFGSEIETPNIARLAADGIKFTHFTNCAKCETTRTTLLSGRYHTEVKGNSKSLITIPENLALGGYQSFAEKKNALIKGRWKLVDYKYLYDLENDRIESHDLSQSNPDKFAEMKAEFARIDQELNRGRAIQAMKTAPKSRKKKNN